MITVPYFLSLSARLLASDFALDTFPEAWLTMIRRGVLTSSFVGRFFNVALFNYDNTVVEMYAIGTSGKIIDFKITFA